MMHHVTHSPELFLLPGHLSFAQLRYSSHVSFFFLLSLARKASHPFSCMYVLLCFIGIMYGRVCQSVPEPIVELVDSQTDAALSPDRVLYYRIGSSLELHCRVQRYWVKPLRFHWLKSGKPVSDDIWRGGIRSCIIRTSLFIQSVCWPSSPETGSNILLHEGQSL